MKQREGSLASLPCCVFALMKELRLTNVEQSFCPAQRVNRVVLRDLVRPPVVKSLDPRGSDYLVAAMKIVLQTSAAVSSS